MQFHSTHALEANPGRSSDSFGFRSVQFSSVTQSCLTLCDPMDCIYSPWNSPGQNTGEGSLSLLQGSFPTQRSNSGLPYCRRILYELSYIKASKKRNSTNKHVLKFYSKYNLLFISGISFYHSLPMS